VYPFASLLAVERRHVLKSESIDNLGLNEQQESKLMDFKQWLHETKQQVEEGKWREKSLNEDLASAVRREQDLQTSVAEMDATIMGLEEVITVHAYMCPRLFFKTESVMPRCFCCEHANRHLTARCYPIGKQQPKFYG